VFDIFQVYDDMVKEEAAAAAATIKQDPQSGQKLPVPQPDPEPVPQPDPEPVPQPDPEPVPQDPPPSE